MAKKPSDKPRPEHPLHEGEVWAVPAPGVGSFAMVVARVPTAKSKAPFVLGYLYPRLFTGQVDVAAIPPLSDWGRAWIGLVAPRPFRNGRWNLVGRVPGFRRGDWPVVPSSRSSIVEDDCVKPDPEAMAHELCSIETTRDEPTMTVLDNVRAEPALAARFPTVGVLTQASKFEAALARFVKGQRPSFWDYHIEWTDVDAPRLTLWADWAQRARARCAGRVEPSIPAGRATDRAVKPGDWLAFPLLGGGFGAALVVRRGPGTVIFGDAMLYCMARAFDEYPTLDQLRGLRPEDAAFVMGTSLIVVRDGRWRVIGSQPMFNPTEWAVPHSFGQSVQQQEEGEITVVLGHDASVNLSIPKDIVALDPYSSEVTHSLYFPGSIEDAVGCLLHDPAARRWITAKRVTPQRLAAWRTLNDAIDRALAAR